MGEYIACFHFWITKKGYKRPTQVYTRLENYRKDPQAPEGAAASREKAGSPAEKGACLGSYHLLDCLIFNLEHGLHHLKQ